VTLGRAFLLWIVGFLVLTLLLVSVLLLRTVQQTLEDELRSHAEVMARSLASAMAAGDLPASLPVLAMRDLRAVEVRDGLGRLLWAVGPEPAQVIALDPTIMEVRESLPVTADADIEGNRIEVVLLVSRNRARQHLASSAIQLLGGLGIALLAAMVIGLALVGRVVRPLNDLAAHARTFHPGRPFDLAAPTGTTSEVAELAHAFSEMAERLAVQRQALSASEQRFRELFAGSPTPLLELDQQLCVRGANLAAAVFLAAEPDECAGLFLADFMEDVSQETFTQALVEVESNGEAAVEGRWRLGDGEQAEVEVHLRPISDEGEAVFLAAIHDLTDRVKRMGERWRRTFDAMVDGVALVDENGEVQLSNLALQPHLSELASEVRQRATSGREEGRWQTSSGECLLQCALTAHSGLRHQILVVRDVTDAVQAEARLREMQKMEAVETLASGVAHDFNNLLAGILLHVRWLLRQPEQTAEAAAAIQALAEEGEEVVRELLLFSRSESTPQRTIDLADLAGEQEFLLGHLLPDTIELVLDTGSEPVPVAGNSVALRRVILNLVLNARDAVGKRDGRVEVRVRRCEDRGEQPLAELKVIDNGGGIPDAHREHLFEPFFSLRREGRGAGLGLAVVHTIVSQHNGEIDVESTPGEGTCITLHLPLDLDQEEGGQAADTMPDKSLAGERVLVVEEDGRLAARLIEELAGAGLDVRHAQSLPAVEEIGPVWRPLLLISVGGRPLPGFEQVVARLGATGIISSSTPGVQATDAVIKVESSSAESVLIAIRQALGREET
jgi:PAS domain S-box-containing protein